MNKLYSLYEEILNYCGIGVRSNGETFITLGEKEYENKIAGKTLKMPYEACLKAYNGETEVIFHPFQEHINRGESDVVKKIRHVLNVRINLAILNLMSELMRLLASPAEHPKLNPQQRELVKSIDPVDMKMWGKFSAAASSYYAENPTTCFSNIYLKKSGTYKGERHPRVGVVSFPLYENFQNRKEKLATFEEVELQLLEFIFPGSKDLAEEYNSFSDNTTAPWFHCLLMTGYNLTSRLNEVASLYEDFINISDDFKFQHDWFDKIQDLRPYEKEILLIPSQRGNEGSIGEDSTAVSQVTSAAIAASNASPVRQTVPNQAVVAPAPLGSTQPAVQAPVVNPANQYVQPLPGAPVTSTQKITPDGKLSFDSVVNNVNTGMMPVVNAGMMYPQMTAAPMGNGWQSSPLIAAQQNMTMAQLQQLAMSNPALYQHLASQGLVPAVQMQQPAQFQPMGYTGVVQV